MVRRLVPAALLGLAMVSVAIGSLVAATPGSAPSEPPAPVISRDDTARVAEEELKLLPNGVVQVECRPGMPTFPPYTRFSGLPGGTFYILADGRCFRDVTAVPQQPKVEVVPTVP